MTDADKLVHSTAFDVKPDEIQQISPLVRRLVENNPGPVTFTGETDRVYSSTAAITLTDPALGRTLRVEKENSANTVVWNPWVGKAAAMADFGDDEWPQMVCIEAANAFDDAVTLQPGESHRLTQRIVLA